MATYLKTKVALGSKSLVQEILTPCLVLKLLWEMRYRECFFFFSLKYSMFNPGAQTNIIFRVNPRCRIQILLATVLQSNLDTWWWVYGPQVRIQLSSGELIPTRSNCFHSHLPMCLQYKHPPSPCKSKHPVPTVLPPPENARAFLQVPELHSFANFLCQAWRGGGGGGGGERTLSSSGAPSWHFQTY